MTNNQSINRNDLVLKYESRSSATTSSDFVLQWGNRKRLRPGTGRPNTRTSKPDLNYITRSSSSKDPNLHEGNDNNTAATTGKGNGGNGYLNLRQRLPSPSYRILRNSESLIAMRGLTNGVKGLVSPDRCDKKGTAASNNNSIHQNKKRNNNTNHHDDNHHRHGGAGAGSGGSGSSETDHEVITAIWPPKFVIGLTNKEKEEDFMAIKGSKLPQRPKKRAKLIQRTLNLVSPGSWLCDLTLERYEVREKKVSKKRPRGLKDMSNMDSDSE